jgi:hypothetical protein
VLALPFPDAAFDVVLGQGRLKRGLLAFEWIS